MADETPRPRPVAKPSSAVKITPDTKSAIAPLLDTPSSDGRARIPIGGPNRPRVQHVSIFAAHAPAPLSTRRQPRSPYRRLDPNSRHQRSPDRPICD